MGAKRVVVEKHNKTAGGKKEKKKKRSCCLTCFLTFLIATVVIFAAIVGVGCYFGNMYSTQYLDMTIGECFSVVSGLYSPNEKKIVTNPYSDEDLDGFYNELKHAVFLKESTKIDLKEILEVVGEASGGEQSLRLAESDGSENTETTEDGENVLMRFLSGIIKKENIDFDRLSSYDETKHEDYLLKLTDKGMAAFVNELLNTMLGDEELMKQVLGDTDLSEYGIDDISKYVSLRQIILGREERDVILTDESGEKSTERKEVTMLTATVQVKLMDAAKPVLEKYIPNSFLASMAHFFVKALLPNNIYLTVGMGLDYETELDIKLNRIDDEKKLALTFKLIDKISNQSVRDTLNETMHESVYSMLSSVTDYADLSAVSNGTFTMDPFATVIDLTGINEELEPQDRVTSKELLTVLSDVLGSDYSAAISPEHTYKDQYLATKDDTDYNEVYGTVYNPTVKDKDKLVNYENEFLKEISDKYLIDLDKDGIPGSGDEIEFADLMAVFGMGSSDKSLEITELINGKKMNDLLDREPKDIKVKINDRMMGAIVSSLIENIMGDGEFASYDIEVEQIIISTKTTSEGVRRYMEIGVSAGISSFTQGLGEAMLSSMLEAFLPERVMLSVKMDITRGDELGTREPEKTEIRYNDLDGAETEKVLKIMGKFMSSLEIESIVSEMEMPIREMLDTMYSTLESIEFIDSNLVLPDIFTTVSDMLFKDEETGERVVSGDEIREMLKGLSGSDDEGFVDSLGVKTASSSYDEFVRDINDKYYIKTDGAPVDKFDDIFAIVDVSSFDSTKFELDRLKHDAREAEELRPMISDGELAHIFAEKMGDNESLSDMEVKIVGIHVGTDGGESGDRLFIKLAIEFSLASLGGDITSILPIEKIYIVATSFVDVKHNDGDGDYYETIVDINKMSAQQKGTLQKMLTHLQGEESALDFDAKALEIGKVICEQLSTLETSLGEGGFEFVNGGIMLTDFYAFLAKATETQASSETLKGAVQGLYEKEDGVGSDYNFTVSNIVGNGIGEFDTQDPMNNFEESPSAENGYKAKMADVKFGAMLERRFTETVGSLRELTIISTESATEKTKKYYGELKELGVASPENSGYMRLVVRLELDKLMGESSNSLISSFLPNYVYVTMYVTLDEPEMSLAAMRINSLSVEEQDALLKIAHLDDDSITTTVNDSLNIISEYHENAQYVDSSAGVGAIFTSATQLGLGAATLSEAA